MEKRIFEDAAKHNSGYRLHGIGKTIGFMERNK